jgi:hypothetical protein
MINQSNNTAKQLDIKIPSNFTAGKNYIPLAQLNTVNGTSSPAIGDYSEPPTSGEFYLGSINGNIQWISKPQPPASGTFVFGSVGGQETWIGTQDCQ